MVLRYLVGVLSLLCIIHENVAEEENSRMKKILPVFQVVRFPNDVCIITGGARNGTCYTAEECSNKGGTNAGSCASGFGVCCTFKVGCGGSSSENNTYFEVTGAVNGECTSRICKQSNVCQIRLDFNTFVITGPSTKTASTTAAKVAGTTVGANGNAASLRTRCSTDSFQVSSAPNVPMVCGTLTGEHVYFDAINDCHDLAFQFGQNAIGNTKPTTRAFNIKVTQIPCNSIMRAPNGCTQWYYGSTTGTFSTFNYDNNIHLAYQNQVICFRRELAYCQICWNSDSDTDIHLGGKGTKAVTKDVSAAVGCCSYGDSGHKNTEGGFDCVMVPGAMKKAGTIVAAVCQAGGNKGLVTATGTGGGDTVCSKAVPFRVEFISDGYELSIASPADASSKGFKLRYTQVAC